MLVSLRAAMTGLALVGGFAMTTPDASAQTSYPRVVCTGGMDCSVDYGPMGQGNLSGGGRVMVTEAGGQNVMVMHLDSIFAQQPREGFVPVVIGDAQNQMTIYVPAAMADQMRRAATTTPRAR